MQLGNLRLEHPLHPFYADNYICDISEEHIYLFKNFLLIWFEDEQEYKIIYKDEVANYRINRYEEALDYYLNVDLYNGAIVTLHLGYDLKYPETENFRIKLEQIILENKIKRSSHDNINELNPMIFEYNKLQKKLSYLNDFFDKNI